MHILRERDRAANDRRTVTKLNDIVEQLGTIRCFADAAFQVGENFSPDQAGPLLALLALISDRLVCAADALKTEARSNVA